MSINCSVARVLVSQDRCHSSRKKRLLFVYLFLELRSMACPDDDCQVDYE
jgi:hypothetical protein